MSINMQPSVDEIGAALLDRHAAWWQRKGMLYAEPEAAPLGRLWLPLTDGSLAEEDGELTPEMVDVERITGAPLGTGPIETIGDQFVHVDPYPQIPWVEAILGVPVRTTVQGGSMRARAHVARWEDWDNNAVHRHDAWFDLLKRLVELLAQRQGGRRAIVQTLMRGTWPKRCWGRSSCASPCTIIRPSCARSWRRPATSSSRS